MKEYLEKNKIKDTNTVFLNTALHSLEMQKENIIKALQNKAKERTGKLCEGCEYEYLENKAYLDTIEECINIIKNN